MPAHHGDEAGVRVRLEGQVEMAERARGAYLELTEALRSPWWRARLQKRAALISEVVRHHAQFEAALKALERQALTEPLPPSLLEVLRHASKLGEQLAALTAKRVPGEEHGLTQRLEHLLAEVLTAKRFIVPGWELRVAAEVLPWPSSELDALAVFERVLALSLTEVIEHEASWREGDAALERVLERLRRVDPSQKLVNAVGREALRLPSRPRAPSHSSEAGVGLHVLLRVLSLRSRFEHAADSFLKRRAGLVAFEPGERFALLRWLHAPELPLIGVTEARAALIRLGNALGGLPEDRDVWPWKQLIILAHHADTVAHTTEGWEQLRDRIEVLAKALNQHVKRGSFDTLSAAVQALRAS